MPAPDDGRRSGFIEHLDLVHRLQPALHEPQNAPTPDQVDDDLLRAYMRTPHDVGGEPDLPVAPEDKQEEQWELNTYVTCECLGWRGIWLSEERRRMQNVDLGLTMYLGLPYYGRWLLAAARVMVEKHHVTLSELIERVAEVRERHAGGLPGDIVPDAEPRAVGDPDAVARNHHHRAARGVGDPQIYAGGAGPPAFAVGDRVRVRELPTIFYTRTQEYVRGASGVVVKVSYESVAPEEETFDRTDQAAEWFYIVRFRMADLWGSYSGGAADTVQTELPQRWLQTA